MKLLLMALVLAVVMVANSVAKPTKPTKVTIPPELLEEIKLKGFEIFQKYLKWKEGLPPGGNTKFQTFFLEWLKNKKESSSPIAEAKAAVNGEASPMAEAKEAEAKEAEAKEAEAKEAEAKEAEAEAKAAEDGEDGEDSQNYEDDEKTSEISNGAEDNKSIAERVLKLCCDHSGCRNC